MKIESWNVFLLCIWLGASLAQKITIEKVNCWVGRILDQNWNISSPIWQKLKPPYHKCMCTQLLGICPPPPPASINLFHKTTIFLYNPALCDTGLGYNPDQCFKCFNEYFKYLMDVHFFRHLAVWPLMKLLRLRKFWWMPLASVQN